MTHLNACIRRRSGGMELRLRFNLTDMLGF